MTFDEVRSDFQRLNKEYGEPNDMTGGFVDAEAMIKVIYNPTKSTSMKYMKSVIYYGFQWGEYWYTETDKFSIHEDEFLLEIYNKYIVK